MRDQRSILKSLIRAFWYLLLLACFSALPARAQNPLAQRVLVVYDPTVADSANVANHYLAARGIPSATVPPNVTVPEGATSANFTISTVPQKTNTFLVITASGGVTQSNTLGVVPMLGGVSLISASVIGGGPVTAAVVLNNYAPAGGTTVTLSSSNPSALPVPVSVTVPQGSYQSVFTLTSNPVSSNTAVTITASLGGTVTSSHADRPCIFRRSHRLTDIEQSLGRRTSDEHYGPRRCHKRNVS
jgi:hypothetical protein